MSNKLEETFETLLGGPLKPIANPKKPSDSQVSPKEKSENANDPVPEAETESGPGFEFSSNGNGSTHGSTNGTGSNGHSYVEPEGSSSTVLESEAEASVDEIPSLPSSPSKDVRTPRETEEAEGEVILLETIEGDSIPDESTPYEEVEFDGPKAVEHDALEPAEKGLSGDEASDRGAPSPEPPGSHVTTTESDSAPDPVSVQSGSVEFDGILLEASEEETLEDGASLDGTTTHEAIHCTGGTEITVEVEPNRHEAAIEYEHPSESEDPAEASRSRDSDPNSEPTFSDRAPASRPGAYESEVPKDREALGSNASETNRGSETGVGPLSNSEPTSEELDGFTFEELDHKKVITFSKGSFLVPNYVSDYLLKNLSLAEQSVFNRLYRISTGFYRRTEPLTISDLAQSCGLNPKFTATVIKSLVSKKLVKVIWGNPLSRKVRFKLILPREVEKRIVLCGVCHDLIHEEEEWEYYPVARSVNGKVQTIVAHVRCVPGEPLSVDLLEN